MNTIPYVRWAGLDFAPPHSAMRTRRLYDHELNYVLSGSGCVIIAGREYRVASDSCFLIQPRLAHAAFNDSGVPWVTLGVHFDWRREADVEHFATFRADDGRCTTDESLFRDAHGIAGWDHRAHAILDLRARPKTRHFLEEVADAFAHSDEFSRDQSGALLSAAILQIQREARAFCSAVAKNRIGPDAQRRLEAARALLETVSPQMLSVGEIAARVGWSADHLAAMAGNAWQTTPRSLQMAARLHRARELLRQEVAVHEVAHQCGFADTSHLARAFRKNSGLSPREFSALNMRPHNAHSRKTPK